MKIDVVDVDTLRIQGETDADAAILKNMTAYPVKWREVDHRGNVGVMINANHDPVQVGPTPPILDQPRPAVDEILLQSININTKVRFKLTGYGWKLWEQIRANHVRNCDIPASLKLEPPGEESHLQLWRFMLLFGKYCHCGSDAIIQDNSLLFESR